jgi:hypothetical protein
LSQGLYRARHEVSKHSTRSFIDIKGNVTLALTACVRDGASFSLTATNWKIQTARQGDSNILSVFLAQEENLNVTYEMMNNESQRVFHMMSSSDTNVNTQRWKSVHMPR